MEETIHIEVAPGETRKEQETWREKKMHTKNISMKNCEVWTELSKYSQWYANNFFSSHK